MTRRDLNKEARASTSQGSASGQTVSAAKDRPDQRHDEFTTTRSHRQREMVEMRGLHAALNRACGVAALAESQRRFAVGAGDCHGW